MVRVDHYRVLSITLRLQFQSLLVPLDAKSRTIKSRVCGLSLSFLMAQCQKVEAAR